MQLPQSLGALSALWEELEEIENSTVVKWRDWYKKHSKWPRWVFRVGGTLVIIMSVSLPFLANVPWSLKNDVIALVGLGIALISSFNAFFNWDQMWRSRLQTGYLLADLHSRWRLEIAEVFSDLETDVERARARLLVVTNAATLNASKIAAGEMAEFFKSVEWPHAKIPKDRRPHH